MSTDTLSPDWAMQAIGYSARSTQTLRAPYGMQPAFASRMLKPGIGFMTALAVLTSAGRGACAADGNYERGVAAYNHRQYQQACSYFEAALKTSPKNLNLLYYDALTWHQMKNWAEAKERYKTIVLLYPQSQQAQSARQVLKSLDPDFLLLQNQANSSGSNTQASSSFNPAESGSASGDSMAGLPDKASFYFTKTADGHMMVKLMLNGCPMKALFDTGAGAYFYGDQLKESGVDTSRAVDGGFARGWAGTPVPVRVMKAEVQLGNLKRTIPIHIEQTTTAFGENLIGQDLLAGYQYAIDDKANRVDLTKKIQKTEQRFDSLYDVPCARMGGHDFIDIEVNGHKIPAFIDTGSDATTIDPQTAEALHIEQSGEVARRLGVGGAWTANVGYATIRLGPIVKKDFRVLIGGSAGTCVGQDFMSGWRCTVDREANVLHFFH